MTTQGTRFAGKVPALPSGKGAGFCRASQVRNDGEYSREKRRERKRWRARLNVGAEAPTP